VAFLGGVTCVSGRQKGLLETPGPLGGGFAQETFRGETETISLGAGVGREVAMEKIVPRSYTCLPFFGLQDLDLEGNVTTYGSVAAGPDSHTRRRQCEPQIAVGGTVDEASITRLSITSR
jgi:hypothetical protein